MRSRKRIGILVLMLCASLLAGGSLASIASARTHHMTKAQKARVRAKLAREVKSNPRVVLTRAFLRAAGQVSYTLPVTLRFRTADDGVTPSTLNLDLGTLGVKTIALTGYLQANATFIDPSASGQLGELRVSIPDTHGLTNGTGTVGGVASVLPNGVQQNGGDATLMASPLTILTNPDVTGKTIAQGGCQDYNSATLGNSGSPGVPYTPGGAGGSDQADAPNLTAALGLDPTTVFRTPWLPIGVAPVHTQTPNMLVNTQTFTGPSGGTAYLFGNPHGPSVDVTLNALTNINSILRDVNTGNALFAALGRQCAQTITGYVPNVLTAHVTGSLDIRPDVTNDGRLRLAVATLSGGSTPDAITACVAPYAQYAAPGVGAGPANQINIGGLSQNPFAPLGVDTAVLSQPVIAGTPQSAPQVPCGTDNVGALNPAARTIGTLGGQVALFGNGTRTFPNSLGDTPINGAPSGLPGVTVPQPCVTGGDMSGCEISLNGTLTPGTITADVLVGTPGLTDRPPATNSALHFATPAQAAALGTTVGALQALVGNI